VGIVVGNLQRDDLGIGNQKVIELFLNKVNNYCDIAIPYIIMIWLELRKQNIKYNTGWNTLESSWAPTRKENGSNWPFWNSINKVVAGDIIFHLVYRKKNIEFIGYSFAATDGYITFEKPTHEGHLWGCSESYFKVDLVNYKALLPSISLDNYFNDNRQFLVEYFLNNKSKSKKHKKHIFYVIQKNKLQCQNGAYFSEFDQELSNKLITTLESIDNLSKKKGIGNSNTGELLKLLKQRIGHQKFSENVKENYSYKCCYPGCEIEGSGFLVSGHIARWADNENLRGDTDNGLCLCLVHDKSFERGYFTLDHNFNIVVFDEKIKGRSWLIKNLNSGQGKSIKQRIINPSISALKEHWVRIGYIVFEADV
jgi:hypothetical protein